MAIVRWEPFRDLLSLQERMNRMFDDSYRGRQAGEDWALGGSWAPAVDIYEQNGNIVLQAELPGLDPKDVDVRVENNVLTLRGQRKLDETVTKDNYHRVERSYGSFTRSFTLPNAVDTRLFNPADEPPAEGPVLILAGDQTQAYRLETALRTLALVARERPGARLLVTGSLVEDGGRRSIRELGLESRVELSGRYAQRDAPALYQRAHLLLHTKRNDPCPNVVLEALSCGLPVVHSASGGLPELVGAEAGIGVPDEGDWEHDVPPDPEALAAGVVSVLDRLDGYRAAARARAVERFDLQPWIERHRLLFAALVERR